jgi:hypothetical protein
VTDGPPRDLEALLETLEEARAALLAALESVSQDAFEREDEGQSLRDVLWHAGLLDDWCRLLIDQSLGGRPLARWKAQERPPHLERLELLREWLTQTRGALLARARRLSAADLHLEFTLPEGECRTPAQLLEELARQDRARAAQVRALLGHS